MNGVPGFSAARKVREGMLYAARMPLMVVVAITNATTKVPSVVYKAEKRDSSVAVRRTYRSSRSSNAAHQIKGSCTVF